MAIAFQSTTMFCADADRGAQTVIAAPMSAAAVPARSLSLDWFRIELSSGARRLIACSAM
jgi:hypothetical protein